MPQPTLTTRSKRLLLGAVAGVFILGGVVAGPTFGPAFGPLPAHAQLRIEGQQQQGFADVVDRVKPAVVSVQVRRDGSAQRNAQAELRGRGGPDVGPNDPLYRFFREFRDRQEGFGGRGDPRQQGPQGPQFGTSQGSGFFVSADGFVVTNNHVVQGGNSYTVVMDDGARLDARLVGSDERTDLAVLKVERQQPFPFVAFSANPPRVGDWVIAIGNPFGLGGSVTAGIVSARGRDIGAGPYDDFLQIDAPVNRGNSGGPSFNQNGEVIGINTAIYSPSGGSVGIGFAIPATSAIQVVNQIRETGSVTRGWLGVQIQPVTDEIARSLGLQNSQGALVVEPQANSPAARAGLRSGDVIVALNGAAVQSPRELTRRVAALEPGANASFEVLRGNRRQSFDVQIGRLENQQQQAALRGGGQRENGAPGQGGDDFATALGLELAPGRGGVQVVDVDPNGPAAQRGLQSGDVIVEIGGERVQSPNDVSAALAAARDAGRGAVLARVRTQQGTRLVPLPTNRS